MKRKQKKNPTLDQPSLRFTATAWAQLLFLRDVGDTEVGAFGVCPNHRLLVEEVQLVKQSCTWATVEFDDESVADYFETQVERGLKPDQFARIWIHTHPGQSASPSNTDEETFERVFGSTDWAVMFILACGGESYARIRQREVEEEYLLETEVDFTQPYSESQFELWQEQYDHYVTHAPITSIWDDEIWPLQDGNRLETFEDWPDFEPGGTDDQILQFQMEEQYRYECFDPTET